MSRNLDRQKTKFQETGELWIGGMTLAEVWEVITDLGVDPRATIFSRGSEIFEFKPKADPSPRCGLCGESHPDDFLCKRTR